MKKNNTTHAMASILMLGFIVLFLILSGRFLYIQGTGEVAGISLQEWADSKRTNTYTIPSQRGEIKDRNGMTLAYDRATYRIVAITDQTYIDQSNNPSYVTDPEKTAELLAPILDMEQQEITDRLHTGIEEEKFQIEFGVSGSDLSQEKKEKIENLNLSGIDFVKETERYYPNGTFASQVIGLAQQKDGEIVGLNGIENQFNELLTGKDGSISYQRDKYNTKLLEPNEIIQEAEDGEDVYLTIDQKVQTLLEDSVSQVVDEYSPERITAIVMDPKTGEILAMTNRPSYNPNELENVQNWYNDAISSPFEPGSTMKIFTYAAAIEEGKFNPDEYFQSGSYKIDDRNKAIRDHNGGKGWGSITYLEGLQRSSNVAAAKLVWEKMGPETFLEYLEAFHFDQVTGIDLPGEQAGRILYDWPIEKITTSFGQGTTVTPIQQMMAATAVANKGNMMKPYIVSKVLNPATNKVVSEAEPEIAGTPISEKTAEETLKILETVISSEKGTAHNVYNLQDYSVAGKTGTAQITNPETGGYMYGNENYIFSFLGMAPADNPELMMYVSVKQPELEATEVGSKPVSFIFKNVMENSLHYLNIEPDEQSKEKVDMVTLPELEGMAVKEAEEKLQALDVNYAVLGNGEKVTGIYTSGEGNRVIPNERIFITAGQAVMPDIKGWSVREVLRLGDILEIEMETMGSGYAIKQSVKTGTELSNGSYLVVEFASPEEKRAEENKEDEEAASEEQAEESME